MPLMRPAFRGLLWGLCAGLALGVILTLWLFRDGRWDRVVFFPLLSGMICALSEIREESKRKAKAESQPDAKADQKGLRSGGMP
ncbi:hypothetical protein [Planotetraspora silvatica]|uniref:hypothetical protein n=1 Tax=Planotetraspora silvatica TaxID=234614 RepID=UPI001950CF13|nr:hypothetical protein [Planotetraspora silvatica]